MSSDPTGSPPSGPTGAEQPGVAGPPRSGLRNPAAAARGVGAAALAAEGLVLLLAIVPLRVLGKDQGGLGVAVMVVLALICFSAAGLLRHRWAWHGVWLIQLALVACGAWLAPAIAIIGVLFALLWGYVTQVRRTVSR